MVRVNSAAQKQNLWCCGDICPAGSETVCKSSRTGAVTLWALVLSVSLHLVLFSVFALVRFSTSSASASSAVAATLNLAQVKKIAESSPVIPKPKIKRSQSMPNSSNPVFKPFDLSMPETKPSSQTVHMPDVPAIEMLTISSGSILPERTEFFGSSTALRKICYVVDCSGSMHGLFGRVREQLNSSVQNLQQDQYFNIIFFRNGQLLELTDGRLMRATPKAKSAAIKFINQIQPGGTTNPLDALKRAMQLHDGTAKAPQLIYFLTDGLDFQQHADGTRRFPLLVENLRKTLAPTTRINTIGFWAEYNDQKILQAVAKHSGGEFINAD